MTLLTTLLYLPILARNRDPSQMTDAINFVADTLMFGGIASLVARALPAEGQLELAIHGTALIGSAALPLSSNRSSEGA